jgi:hypothetical protein
MLRLAILAAGIVVCLPALAVALFLRDIPGASAASMAAFALIYLPFILAAIFARQMKDVYEAMMH